MPRLPDYPLLKIDFLKNVTSKKLVHETIPFVYKDKVELTNGLFYEGNFRYGKMCGEGIISLIPVSLTNDDFKTIQNNVVYIGQMKNNKINGKGTIFFENRFAFQGKFVDGIACGYGKILDKKNKKIVLDGVWINGEYHN